MVLINGGPENERLQYIIDLLPFFHFLDLFCFWSQRCFHCHKYLFNDLLGCHALEQSRNSSQIAAILHAPFIFRSCDFNSMKVNLSRSHSNKRRCDKIEVVKWCKASKQLIGNTYSKGIGNDLLDKKVEVPSCTRSYATADRSMEAEKCDYVV